MLGKNSLMFVQRDLGNNPSTFNKSSLAGLVGKIGVIYKKCLAVGFRRVKEESMKISQEGKVE